MIIRTASEGVSQEALERDVRRLQAQWEVVKTKSEQTGPSKPKAPVLLYEEPDLLIKVVRDQFNEDFSRLVVEGDDAWDTLQNYVGHVAPELADRLHRHVGTATCSPRTGSTSSCSRRWTARCGCPRAARWSSTAPRR